MKHYKVLICPCPPLEGFRHKKDLSNELMYDVLPKGASELQYVKVRGKYIYSKLETIPGQLFENWELFPGKFFGPSI